MAYKGSARFRLFDLDTPFSDLQFSWPGLGLGNAQHELDLIPSNASPAQAFSNFDSNKPVITLPSLAHLQTEQRTVRSCLTNPLLDQIVKAWKER
jgi:hypothetical protein